MPLATLRDSHANRNKMRSHDRILVLTLVEGTKALDSKGLVDTRLFTGENRLHAVMDPRTCTWSMKYDMGGIPPVLKGMFTNFHALLKHAREYFKKRNIEINEVLD